VRPRATPFAPPRPRTSPSSNPRASDWQGGPNP
jgi:hypothetical protein